MATPNDHDIPPPIIGSFIGVLYARALAYIPRLAASAIKELSLCSQGLSCVLGLFLFIMYCTARC